MEKIIVSYDGGQSRYGTEAVDYMRAVVDGVELYAEVPGTDREESTYEALRADILDIAASHNIDESRLQFHFDQLAGFRFARVGRWWNDSNVELVRLEDGRVFALSGWNGESYTSCWECTGPHNMDASTEKYTLTPIQIGVGRPDQDGEFAQYETVAFEFGR